MNKFNLQNANSLDLIQLENILKNKQTRDFAGEAWLTLANGKSPSNLLAYAKTCVARAENEHREMRATFISLDDRHSEDEFSYVDRLAAADPCELSSFRQAILHTAAELSLQLVNEGAHAIACNSLVTGGKKLCKRRGEQIRKNNIDKLVQAESFKQGKNGQGVLFGFDGETDHA